MQKHLFNVRNIHYLCENITMERSTPRTRITSLHGVLLPPRKKTIWPKTVTLRFVITGTIPSKKNMIWADTNLFKLTNKLLTFTVVRECVAWLKSNLKAFIRNSQKYVDWKDGTTDKETGERTIGMAEVITAQAAAEIKKYDRHGLTYPLPQVTVKVYHYWKDNMARDNSNKYDTIIDLFTSCGLITDDCWQVVRNNESESECYFGEILDHITEVYLTVPVTA